MKKAVLSMMVFLFLGVTAGAADVITVNSLSQLKTYLGQSDIQVKMTPGIYSISESDKASGFIPTEIFFNFSGSNCTYDFTGVTLNVNTNILDQYGNISTTVIYVSGDNNHLFGLAIKDIGNERPYRSACEMEVAGDYNTIEEFNFYVSGSYPYAYGDLFGKGSGYVIKHFKHSALLIRGIGSHILNCYVEMHAYGHGIFMQGSVNTLVEGCYVKGFTRTTDEVLAETSGPAFNVDFMTVWGWPVPAGYTFSLSEDGIRCYNDGTLPDGMSRNTETTTVKNCTVENMRGGVTIGFSNNTNYISGCTVIGGENGFWPGDGDTIVHCQGDPAYASVIDDPYQDDDHQNISITVLHETEVHGNTQLAYIAGSSNNITLLNSGIQPRPYTQTIQMAGLKVGMRYMEIVDGRNDFTLSTTTVTNWTDQPVVLDAKVSTCNVLSYGPVTNHGTGNTISPIRSVTATASASAAAVNNTIDANAGTSWTTDGQGQWIQYDLGQTRNLYAVMIKWLNGSSRRYFFNIQTSNSTAGPWTTAFSGASYGVTDDFEEYDFKTQNARYIKVTGFGNSVDNTMQIVDFDVDLKDRFAMVKTKSDDGNIAQNTLDGNLNTRWAAQGDGQWIQYDLLKPKIINAVSLAWYLGNTRISSFDIKTSYHPMGPWTTAFSGSSSGATLQLEEYKFTPVSARFLRVTGHGNSQDTWNGITEIFIKTGISLPDTNIAINGIATQSSTGYESVASKAIDGNASGVWAEGSVTHTAVEPTPWWRVDLGSPYDIDEIQIYGRTDSCCIARLSNYDVNILDCSGDIVWSNYQSSYPNPSIFLDAGGAIGRYVLIQLRDTNALSLAEVRILSGTPARYCGDLTLDGKVNLKDAAALSAGWQSGYTMDDLLGIASDWLSGTAPFSLSFDGIDDSVAIPGYKGILGTQSRTCAAWIKTPGMASNTVILNWGAAASGQQWIFGLFSTGELAVYAGGPYIKTTALVNDNQWHHVAAALTDDGSPDVSEIKLYIDGVLQTTANTPGSVNTVGSYDVLMGAFWNGSSPSGFFKGLLDDVRIYSRPLTAAEIGAIENISEGLAAYWNLNEGSGNMARDVVSGYTGTIYGAQWTAEEQR